MFRPISWIAAGFLACCGTAGAAELKAVTFTGHTGAVNAVAVTPDGKLVASTGGDATVRIWDVRKAKQLLQLNVQSPGWSVAFSPDGKTLAVPAQDNSVRLFDVATGRQVRSFVGHLQIVWAAAFTPDGKTLASTSADGTVRIWDVATGKEQRQLAGSSGPWSLSFSADGSTLAVGFDNGKIGIWDARTWRAGREWSGGDGGIWPVAVAPDGRSVASVQWQSGTVRLWETATGQLRDSFDGAGGGGWAIGFAPDGRTAVGVGPNGVTLWSPLSGKQDTIKTATILQSVACANDGRTVAAGDANGAVHVWDIHDVRIGLTVPTATVPAREMTGHWTALAGTDAEKAFQSIRILAAGGASSVAQLRELVQPAKVEVVDAAAVAKLVAQLDDDEFEAREKATVQLAALGSRIASVVRMLLQKTKSVEARSRLEKLLELWAKTPLSTEELRALRAVEVLETIGTTEARQVVKALAGGAADAVLTREAKAAVSRMTP